MTSKTYVLSVWRNRIGDWLLHCQDRINRSEEAAKSCCHLNAPAGGCQQGRHCPLRTHIFIKPFSARQVRAWVRDRLT
jgi:hypothetical protein